MCFIWERLMDIVARRLGLDPAEIRTRNYIRPEEFPYTTPNGNVYESGNYHETLRRALETVGYAHWRAEQERLRREGRYIGIGLSTSVEPGGTNLSRHYIVEQRPRKAGASEAATIKIDVTGKVTVAISQPDAGLGHATTAAQIAAEELGVDLEDVNVIPGFDTLTHPWTGYSGLAGNDYTPVCTPAIVGAAHALREKVLRVASHLLSADRSQLAIDKGLVHIKGDPNRAKTLREIAYVVYNQPILLPEDVEPGLQATYFYRYPYANFPDEKKRVKSQFTFGNAAHVAVVEVEIPTGYVKTLRYVVVGDYGTIINPLIVEGQVHGNAAHAISAALGEGFVYDENGQLLTSTFVDYGKPSAADTPDIEVHHMETPTPFNPLGAKSIGEGAAVLAPAAIANAVEDALTPFGVKVTELPLTPERLWRLVRRGDNPGG